MFAPHKLDGMAKFYVVMAFFFGWQTVQTVGPRLIEKNPQLPGIDQYVSLERRCEV